MTSQNKGIILRRSMIVKEREARKTRLRRWRGRYSSQAADPALDRRIPERGEPELGTVAVAIPSLGRGGAPTCISAKRALPDATHNPAPGLQQENMQEKEKITLRTYYGTVRNSVLRVTDAAEACIRPVHYFHHPLTISLIHACIFSVLSTQGNISGPKNDCSCASAG